jgi:hypothetical protein
MAFARQAPRTSLWSHGVTRSLFIFTIVLIGGCVTEPAAKPQDQLGEVKVETQGAQLIAPDQVQSPPRPRTEPPPQVAVNNSINTDPCATRLHDLCGPLLLYYSSNRRLPRSLDELKRLPGFEDLEFVCPASKQPYVYTPAGALSAGATVILADPTPAHGGIRWGISAIEAEPGRGIVTKVVVIPANP